MLRSLASEFVTCNLSDQRLTNRLINLVESISENPELSINAACGSFAASKAAYRFFQNPKVTPESIMLGHRLKTKERCSEKAKRILVIQDTTDLIYTQFPSIEDLGIKIRSKEGFKHDVRGLMLHTSFAVSSEGVPLGILKQTTFTYDEIKAKRGQAETCMRGINKTIPIEEKASHRWIEHLKDANQLCCDFNNQVVHVADRECDIYEFLQVAFNEKAQFVVRSSANRRTDEGRDSSTIDEKLAASPNLGVVTVKKDSEDRTCQIRSITTYLRPPQRSSRAKSIPLEPLSVGVVEVREVGENKDPIHWRLLTNLPVKTFEAALEIVEIYRQRWSIECFHRILKSGFGVEKARFKNRKRIENLASVLSIVSWHIFWLYQLGRNLPSLDANKIFDKITIEVLKKSASQVKVLIGKRLSIADALIIIAKLGGFLARRGDGNPGMINIWRGWRRLHDRIALMEAITYG